MPTLILPSGRVDGHLAQRGHETTGLATRGTDGSNPPPSTGESTANLSFRVGIASMTVGCEEIRRAWHRHVTVGAYYKRAVRRLEQSNDARPSRPLGRCGASVREIGGRR